MVNRRWSVYLFIMFQLTSKITIGSTLAPFYFVNEVKIKKAWRTMTNNSLIKLPRNLKTRGNLRIDEVLKYGDAVSIELGYDITLVKRFQGYVTGIGAATAICEISCEDEMWNLKQNSLTKSWPSATVEDIIVYIKQKTGATWNYSILGDKITLGAFRVERASACKILQALKDQYGIYSFFRQDANGNQVLTVGKPYEPDSSKWTVVNFEYGRNVISWKDLSYKRATEVRIKVTARNHMPNGSITEISLGDPDGEEHTLDFYNLSAATLKSSASELLAKMKFDGYRGKIHAFGEPVCNDGYVAQITDWRYPERNGSFFIDAVETTFKVPSYRQEIELGPVSTIANT